MFLHEKTVNVLLQILEAERRNAKLYVSQLSNAVNSPYSYVSRLIKQFEENSLVETRLEGRVRVVRLTPFGRKVAELLESLVKELRKDIRALNRLRTLEEIARKGGDFRALAGVVAELEILRRTGDEVVRAEASRLLKLLEEMGI